MQASEFTQALQISHSLTGLYLIEASAGTGKTYTISNLYLRHILSGRNVSEILVVSFTNAATEELKGRIRLRLYQAYQQLKQGKDEDEFLQALLASLAEENQNQAQQRLDLALRSMDESAIYSIHGFCQKALADFAFLSGQTYQLEMNNDKEEWLHPFILDWWRNHIATQQHSFKFANYEKLKWTNYQNFQKFYHCIAEKQVLIEPNKNWQDVYQKLQQCYLKLKKAWQQESLAEQLIEKSFYKKNKGLLRDATLLKADTVLNNYFEADNFSYFAPELESFSYQLLAEEFKKGFSETDIPSSPFFKLVDDFSELNKKQLGIFVADNMRQAKATITQNVEQYKKKKQQVSFQDLITHLNTALLNKQQGKALQKAIQQQYPVAFIDEFQDTDTIQYSIFSQLYFTCPNTALYMIGDPKQAIYSFRGGDIVTYIQAKQDLIKAKGQILTLNTNWRSTPNMISAVNSVFAKRGNDAFLYSDMIPFEKVNYPNAQQKPAHKILTVNGEVVTPLNFWLLNNQEKTTKKGDVVAISKEDANKVIDENVCHQIVSLLNLAKQNKAFLGDAPLKASDIAVLVPDRYDANRLQNQLMQQGVKSVVASKKSVYQSEQAEQLLSLITAVLHYKDHQKQRNALACQLVNLTYDEIFAFINNEQQWGNWCKALQKLNQTWLQHGFMAMFMQMIHDLNLVTGIKKSDFLERSLTNLFHLAELIQQAAKKHSTKEDLLSWYATQVNQSAGEETEIRLESDENLVKIATIHVSKGLEYGVVFLPYLWASKVSKDAYLIYHNEHNQLVLQCAHQQQEKAKILADYERLAEQVRLTYVAMTRSIACCYVCWGNIKSANASALGYLLHDDQSREQLISKQINCTSIQSDQAIEHAIESLASKKEISQQFITPIQQTAYYQNEDTQQQAKALNFTGKINRQWQITSYSKLISQHLHSATVIDDEKGNDAIFDFVAGKKAGSYLHELLEKVDFHQDIKQQVNQLNEKLLLKFDLSPEISPIVVNWLAQIIATPINQQGLSLQSIKPAKCLKEMVFNFSSDTVNIEKLNQLLKKANPDITENIQAEQFKGIVNGIIDLVFEWQGKYYIADYKSNLLGRKLSDYTPDKLAQDVLKHRYDLQYFIYSVALNKYLASRLDNYQYEKHFGGVYYLYIRAMRVSEQNKFGVFYTKPSKKLMEDWFALFD